MVGWGVVVWWWGVVVWWLGGVWLSGGVWWWAVVGWYVSHEILVSAQGPLVLAFWVWGLGVLSLGLSTYYITWQTEQWQ